VTLNPGEQTRVDAGRPPTPPAPAPANVAQQANSDTAASTDPEALLVMQTATANISGGSFGVNIAAGSPLTLDGRTSAGGSSNIVSYAWAIPRRNFTSTEPVIALDTNGWPPGTYEGTLTVTNATGRSASTRFQVIIVNPSAARARPKTPSKD